MIQTAIGAANAKDECLVAKFKNIKSVKRLTTMKKMDNPAKPAPVMIDEWMIGMGVGVEIRAGYHVVSDEQLAIFEMAPDITVGYVDRVSQKVSINGKDKKDREQPEKEGSLS
jgi:hypothetical protein